MSDANINKERGREIQAVYFIPPKPKNSLFNDEQWQAIHQKGSNLLVAASAGSGKTTVLIERILNHIESKYAGLDELLVVTFTELAAKEMKERMEVRLKEAITDTVQAEVQQHYIDQIRKLPTAHIRTLHSFCLQVIQQFFYIIDFNPNFQLVTDETQKALIYQEVWQELYEKLEGEEETTFITQEAMAELLSQYASSRSDESLYDLVLDLYQFASAHPEPVQWLKQLDQTYLKFDDFTETKLYQGTIEPLLKSTLFAADQLLDQAETLLSSAMSETIERYQPIFEETRTAIQHLYEAVMKKDLKEIANLSTTIPSTRWPTAIKKLADDHDLIKELKDLRDQAKDRLDKGITKIFDYDYETTQKVEFKIAPVIKQISQLVLSFQDALSKKKRDLNLIDYNDLEHLTLDILAPYNEESGRREGSSAAIYYQQLFKEVMVDEYQDINEIQSTILAWLSHEHRPDLAGNLFMVGDVKQSIYGFRMAEPSLFLEKYLSYRKGKGGELIVLDQNYRSRDEVLQFTNFIFERLMDESFGEMNYQAPEALKAGNKSFKPQAPSQDFNIELLIHNKEGVEDTRDENELEDDLLGIESSLEAEAHLIAQDISGRIQRGEQIYDSKLDEMRPVTYKDFVILTSTRNPFLSVQRAFEAYNIPLFTQKVENYFQRQEIQWMLALLKLIDNPFQDIPLVAILRSYFVGLTDEELSQIRIHTPQGGFYEAVLTFVHTTWSEETFLSIQNKLRQFLSQLNRWQKLSQDHTLVELIWTIYQETHFIDYVVGLPNGDQREANLHAFYERAREFEQSTFKGVFGFVRYIEQVMKQSNDLAEPVILDEDQDGCRIMTVHASKGLEFPIVYIMDMAKRFNMQDVRKSTVASKHSGLGTHYFDSKHRVKYLSFVKRSMDIQKANELKAEEMRKLYVALTRCEQKLILVGSMKDEELVEKIQAQARELTSSNQILIQTGLRQGAQSWLEWVLQALAVSETEHESVSTFDVSQVNLRFVTTEDVDASRPTNFNQYVTLKESALMQQLNDLDKMERLSHPVIERVSQLMRVKYPYQLASHTSSYQSVSELKRLYEEPRIEKIEYYEDRRIGRTKEAIDQDSNMQEGIHGIRYTQDTFQPPQFMQDKTMDAAQIGTLTHYFLQLLDFAQFKEVEHSDYLKELHRQADLLVTNRHLSESEVAVIKFDSIAQFLETDEGQIMIKYAKDLKREQAFSYLLPAHKLFQQQVSGVELQQLGDDQLLVHGVVDVFIETDEGLLLFDYKTDRYRPYVSATRVDQIEAIKDKYRFQMSLYAKAIEAATGKVVQRASLILLDFDEVVELDKLYTI